jgi:hypothetical protein
MSTPVFYFLVLALVARVVLDLFTLTRSNYLVDLAYCVLYLTVGAFLVIDDTHDLLGYLSIGLAVFWAVKGGLEFKRKGIERHE